MVVGGRQAYEERVGVTRLWSEYPTHDISSCRRNTFSTGNKDDKNGCISYCRYVSHLQTDIEVNSNFTYVAPARTSSIVLDLVSSDNMARYMIIDIVMITIRADVVLVTLQITTGSNRRHVTRDSNISRAIRLIKRPEYKYTFGSTDRS